MCDTAASQYYLRGCITITMSQAKRWCYTYNNPVDVPPFSEEDFVYHVYGEETGESGTPHYQGFIIFKKYKRLTQLKKILNAAHFEVAKGTNAQASDYCKKDGKYHEFGSIPPDPSAAGGKATKAKYERAFKHAKNGELDEIDADLRIKHYRTFKQIAIDYANNIPPLETTAGIWIYGESGIGKSRYAREKYPDSYVKNCNKWWDGYQNEDYVIIDDLDDSHSCLGHYLKRWADHYAFTAETKGGSLYIRPQKIIVTTQYRIEEIFKDGPTVQALTRRFEFINFNNHPDRVQ